MSPFILVPKGKVLIGNVGTIGDGVIMAGPVAQWFILPASLLTLRKRGRGRVGLWSPPSGKVVPSSTFSSFLSGDLSIMGSFVEMSVLS